MTSVTQRFTTDDPDEREAGIAAASLAVQRGELVVLPTDTVYGVGADAFSPAAVASLLEAKGRGRDMPPPVLIAAAATLDALAVGVPAYARALVEELWPGPLTLVCRQQRSLRWDLGDARGTVAVQHVDALRGRALPDMTDRRDVVAADIPRHRDAGEAEREHLGEVGKRCIGAFTAAGGVGNDADLVAARRLAVCEVANMPE